MTIDYGQESLSLLECLTIQINGADWKRRSRVYTKIMTGRKYVCVFLKY
jgi:hypothetical protein